MGAEVLARQGTIDEFIRAVYNFPTLTDLYKYAAYDGLGAWDKLQVAAANHPKASRHPIKAVRVPLIRCQNAVKLGIVFGRNLHSAFLRLEPFHGSAYPLMERDACYIVRDEALDLGSCRRSRSMTCHQLTLRQSQDRCC